MPESPIFFEQWLESQYDGMLRAPSLSQNHAYRWLTDLSIEAREVVSLTF